MADIALTPLEAVSLSSLRSEKILMYINHRHVFALFLNEDMRLALSAVSHVLRVRAVFASYTLGSCPLFASEQYF